MLVLFGRRIGIQVSGDSMVPTLKNDDRVIVDLKQAIGPGDLVLANHPYKKSIRIIKRVASIDPDANFFLVGDNPDESSDSKAFGAVPSSDIVGKVISKIE